MAENLVTTKYIYSNLLHTYSVYNGPVEFSKPSAALVLQSINQLKAQEERAYKNLFPSCSSFEEFISSFRGLFDENFIQDKTILASFANPKLFPILEKARENYQKEGLMQEGKSWNFQLQVDNQAAKKLQALTGSLGKNTELKFLSDLNLWEVVQKDFDIVEVKKIFNAAFGTRFWAGGKRGTSVSKKALQNFINRTSEDTFRWVKSADSISSLYIDYDDPFSYDAEKLHGAENNKDERQEIIKGAHWIKNSIERYFLNNASEDLRHAFEKTWSDNFDHRWQNIALFMKRGGNTALAGAFGEFQAALITNYILTRFQRISPQAQALISNSLQKREQARRDVTILGDVGIQVKNYDPQNSIEISTTVHPSELQKEEVFARENINSLFRFLANYYFNLSYVIENGTKKNQLTDEILPAYFAQIANLDLGEIFRRDTVSFYLIEGRYLVPASHIAEQVYYNQLYAPITITSSFRDMETDQGFNKGVEKKYAPYWDRSSGEWEPTDYNKATYQNLLSKDISIRTNFARTTLTVAKYDLFTGI